MIQDIKQFNNQHSNCEEITNYLQVLQSEFEKQPSIPQNFKTHEINYGYEIHEKMKISKAFYLIDLYDLLQPFFMNPGLKTMLDANYESNNSVMLKSFFDGSYYKSQPKENLNIIYLSIYADEINLINPIGN